MGCKQFTSGKDMTCYNGSPDVDFAKAAGAYGVEGETVTDPGRHAVITKKLSDTIPFFRRLRLCRKAAIPNIGCVRCGTRYEIEMISSF